MFWPILILLALKNYFKNIFASLEVLKCSKNSLILVIFAPLNYKYIINVNLVISSLRL